MAEVDPVWSIDPGAGGIGGHEGRSAAKTNRLIQAREE